MNTQKRLELETLKNIPVEKQLEIMLNATSKQYNPSEIAAIGECLEKELRKGARERQATSTGGKHPQLRKKMSEPGQEGRVLDAVGNHFDLSRGTYSKIRFVVEHGSEEQIQQMDKNKKIDRVWREVRKDQRIAKVQKQAETFVDTDSVRIICGDMREKMLEIDEQSIDCIVTDPPWKREYLPLWNELGRLAERVLVPGGFLFAYTACFFLPDCLAGLSEHLEFYYPITITFDTGYVVQQRNIRGKHKIVAIYNKPPRRLAERCLDSWIKSSGAEKDLHPWQQPVDDLKDWIDACTRPGNIILDPCCGSGSFLVLGRKMHRRVIGIDVDPQAIETTKGRLEELEIGKNS